jgi:hypothetical protein
LGYIPAIDQDADLALFIRLDHHALVAHPAHHIERLPGCAPQRQFFHVRRHGALQHGPQFLAHLEIPVRRAEPALQALVRPFEVIVFDPVSEPLLRLRKRLELGALQELILQRLPEALDLPERLRVLRLRAEVVHVVAGQLLLELGLPAPSGVLPAVVGEQLLRNPVVAHRLAVTLDDVRRVGAAIQVQPGHVARIVVEKADDIPGLALQREGRDIALPELVRPAVLEAPVRRLRFAPRFLLRRRRQPLRLDLLVHRRRTGPHAEQPPQQLRDPPRAPRGIGALQFHDLGRHRTRQAGRLAPGPLVVQPGFTPLAIPAHPLFNRGVGDSQFLGHQLDRQPFFEPQLHGFAPDLRPVAAGDLRRRRPRSPPRGRGWGFLLLYCDHDNTPFPSLRECYPFSPIL